MKMQSLAIASMAAAALTMATGAQAVTTCQALSLYTNAANTGLCRSLGPTTQNLWVCVLADNPDIHLTFNAGTNLHITVRKLNPDGSVRCEGNAQFNGVFPGALALAQPHLICDVTVASYVPRLNDVAQIAATPNQTFVQTAALAAVAANRLTHTVAQTYIDTASPARQNCP